jgi:hypothetical protein
MRKSILFFFILWCNIGYTLLAQTNESGINPASTSTIWFQNRNLKLLDKSKQLQYYQITKGQNWVFQYTYKAADIAEITDDEFSESVIFELTQTSRNKIKQKIAKTKHAFIYLKSCYCPDAGPMQILKGSIKAKKLNQHTWHVKIQFELPSKSDRNRTKKIEGNFTFVQP